MLRLEPLRELAGTGNGAFLRSQILAILWLASPRIEARGEAQEWAETGQNAPFALQIDTAMNRLGFDMAALASNKAYLNIHTNVYPGGEIRGFLTAVPEPATWMMMMMGSLPLE